MQACAARIKGNPEADCESWYFDYYKCLDKWVSSEQCCTFSFWLTLSVF